MTKERLVQAIQAHDPDGCGIDRVVTAARTGQLCRWGSKGPCLLMAAWTPAATCVLRHLALLNNEIVDHGYADVVEWFDGNPDNRPVLDLLVEAQ